MRVTTDRQQCARVCADPDEGAGDTRGRRSGTRRLQIPQADQVIGRGGESELPIDEWDAAMPELAQTTDGLHPPKDLFHEFSFPLTHVITRMPGGPTINRTPADLLRHVGRDVPDADIGDEARHIVALVCSDRAARRRAGLQQQCRRLAFGGPRRVGRTDVGDEPMPIIQQHVAQIRQLRLLPLALPMQHRLRISRRLVRVVAPPLAVEVDRGIPGVIGGRARRGVQASEALQAGPGFQLRPVHREMLFHQQPFAPDRVQHLQQQGPQQLLRRDRRTSRLGVQAGEPARHRLQRVIRQRADRAERMTGRHALFRRQVTEHVMGLLIVSAHDVAPFSNIGSMVVRRDRSVDPIPRTFSAAY